MKLTLTLLQAIRLVLELNNKRDGGGWCRGAVRDKVEEILLRKRVPTGERVPTE